MQLNYEKITTPTHKVVSNPVKYNDQGTNYESIPNTISSELISVREKPSNSNGSKIVASLPANSQIVMRREWADGEGNWSFIQTKGGGGEEGTKGYILTKYLVPIPDYTNNILPKENIAITPMTPIAKLLFEATPWMENDFPKLHPENGEWWVTVTLPYTCLEEGSLAERQDEAKTNAIQQVYDYFGIQTNNPSIPSISDFKKGFLSSYVKDYYLGSRPGSNLMMLVVIPAIYVEYVKQNSISDDIPQETQEEFCIFLKANSIDDLDDLKSNIKSCFVDLYQKYINSTINVTSFNFEKEIFNQLQGIEKIKFLLKENNINLESKLNKTSGQDSCEETSTNSTIKVCFDSEYKLIAVYYYNNSGEESVLSSGLNSVKNSHPFNEPRFGLMFLKHREICSLAPSLKMFFKDYVIDPQPEVTTITWSEKSQLPLSNLASAELQVYIDSALFLTGLAQELGNLFDLRSLEGTLSCYGDPSQSKLVQAYKLKAAEFRDSQIMYTSDVVNIASWICSDRPVDEFEEIDWDQIGEDIFGTAEGWGEWWESLSFSDWTWPTFSFIGIIKDNAEKAADEAKEQIKNEFLKFFATLYCELLLVAAAAATAGIGYGIYLSIKEDQNGNVASSFPSPAETASFDYGAENVNDVISESIGSDPSKYDADLIVLFENCGVSLGATQKPKAREYLDSISSILAPVEVLSLLEGTAAASLTNTISKYTQTNFPEVHQFKNTSSKIAEFFACLGGSVTQEAKDKVQKKIIDKIEDVDICIDICEELKKKMKEKCPNPEVYNSVCEKEFTSKVKKYQEIIALINDDCSLQPKYFNNSKTGEKGIFSNPKNQPQSTKFIVQKLTETTLGPTIAYAESQSSQYFLKYENKLKGVSDALTENTNLVVSNQKGTQYSYLDPSSPVFILDNDGSQVIDGVIISQGKKISLNLSPQPLGSGLQTIMQNSDYYNDVNSNLKLSRQQILFYSLIEDYFKNNSKNGTGKETGMPIPYAINNAPLPPNVADYNDSMFSLVFERLLEMYARQVGISWEGDQNKFLKSYSTALSQNIKDITGYEEVRQLIMSYYDSGEYDNPNDSTTKSSLQISLLNGILNIYSRLYIMEYFSVSMPFYEVYKPYSGTVAPLTSETTEFVREYVLEKIENDLSDGIITGLSPLGADFNSILNETYDRIKTNINFELPNYSGGKRGIKFYVNTNIEDVYHKFEDAMAKSQFKKQKSNIYSGGKFIFNDQLGFQTHEYAGIRTLTSDSQLGGEKQNSSTFDVSQKPYSLFKGDRYNYFKNGMFFIQNYFVFEEIEEPPGAEAIGGNSYADRKDYLKGVVNLDQIKQIHGMIAGKNSFKLNELFKNIRYGSRLCYGIAYRDNDLSDTTDENVRNFARGLFMSYTNTKTGVIENNGQIPDSFLDNSAKVSQFQKYIVCVDGNNFDFKKAAAGEFATKESEYVLSSNWNPTPDGTFSVVIPIFSIEKEESLEKTWNEFYKSLPSITNSTIISDIDKFKNLNTELINSDKFKALIKSCFPVKDMIHYNAIAGIESYAQDKIVQDAFKETKQIMVSSISSVSNGKKTIK